MLECVFGVLGVLCVLGLVVGFCKIRMDMQMAKANPEAYVRLKQIENEQMLRMQQRIDEKKAAVAKGVFSVGSFLLNRRR